VNMWCSSSWDRGSTIVSQSPARLGSNYWSMMIVYGDGQLELRGKALSEAPEASRSSLIARSAHYRAARSVRHGLWTLRWCARDCYDCGPDRMLNFRAPVGRFLLRSVIRDVGRRRRLPVKPYNLISATDRPFRDVPNPDIPLVVRAHHSTIMF
jgi:hypothetical protein